MSELDDDFKEMKKASQEKRASNRETSKRILRENGIFFESKNAGAHLVVRNSWGHVFDFWPGTGKFIERKGRQRKGRGVWRLVAILKERGEG